MCDTCGCGNNDGVKIRKPYHSHGHYHSDGSWHEHDHEHIDHSHDHHDHEEEAHHSHEKKRIELGVDILAGNNTTAAMNRRFFQGRKVLCLNMVSSPGSGKTTILEKTIIKLREARKIFVIEGDQQTLLDASRIEKAGAPSVQINTGSGCHLDASMIESALEKLDIDTDSVLFIENVGNLVCPAMFDLGEFRRVVVISVTEGDDKPLKYPYMFQTSHLCIINKSDLLPYVNFSIENAIKNARSINPGISFLIVSAVTGEGLDAWYDWLIDQAVLFTSK